MKIKSKAKRLNNSYQKTFRNRHLIAVERELNDQEFRLWDLYIALYDWDTRHEHYGCVVDTDIHIAKMINWSESKVCRYRNSLIEKGMVKMNERSVLKVWPIPGYDEYCLNKNNLKAATLEVQTIKTDSEPFTTEPDRIQNSFTYKVPNKVNKRIISSIEDYLRCRAELVNILALTSVATDPSTRNQTEMRRLIEKEAELKCLITDFQLSHKGKIGSTRTSNNNPVDDDEETPF